MHDRSDEQDPIEIIRATPKCELHLHLEGSIAPGTLVELSRRHDADPLTQESAEQLYRYSDFQSFLMAFKAVNQRLQTADDYELITYEMVRRLAQQGIVHAEVNVSVGVVYYWRKVEFEPLLEGIERGRRRAEQDFGTTIYWFFDAVRHFPLEDCARVFRLAADLRDSQISQQGSSSICGIDIGGDEARGPAQLFRELYAEARDRGLHLRAHAGETVGPESIWAAINIGAERLGHALTAQFDDDLMDLLVERQIPLELCPGSNAATGVCRDIAVHPLRRYFESGLLVTLNSDDPPMFRTDLLNEYRIAHDVFALDVEQLRELCANSVEASFLPPERKVKLLRQIIS